MKTKRWSYAHNGVLSVLAGIALVGCDPGQDGQEMGNQDLTSDTAAASLEYAPWVSKPSANSAKTTTVLPSANARFLGFLDLGGGSAPEDEVGRREIYCARRFATQAYDSGGGSIHSDCGLKPTPWNSTDVMKVFDSISSVHVQVLLFAFAGTRGANAGDILRDLQSQMPRWHKNPLDNGLPQLGSIGSGWDSRWYYQAAKVKGILDWYINDAKSNGKALRVYVVGHSLGAVTATVAGYDIAQYLKGKQLSSHGTFVYSFNAPRLGANGSARTQYQAALFGSNCPAEGNELCLLLRQFTRNLDAVQSVPLDMAHPVWDVGGSTCSFNVGDPDRRRSIGYCTQIHTAALSYSNPFGNHYLAGWDNQIRGLPDETVDRMFLQ